jgi:cysteine desulfurase
MGFSLPEISGSLRLSLGPQNTEEEIDHAVATLKAVVEKLREFSPLKYTLDRNCYNHNIRGD